MKKFLFSALLAASFCVNAQDNWQNTESGGFNYMATFTKSWTFQNKLYVSGDTTSHVLLYSSPTGASGSFTEETAFQSVLQPNESQITSAAANSSYMFMGTIMYYDTTGGVTGATPSVYRFDGATYTQHGTFDFASLPANNRLVSGSWPQFSGMTTFSPTGSNDTVYAFLNPGYPNNLSVWKAPANQANPTWVNSTNFSVGSNISSISSAKVWHNKLYIIVSNYTNGGMILRTSDGANWDTVTAGINMGSVLGAFPQYTNFTSLEVFKDTLVASVMYASNGVALVYTADSLAQNQTWNALIDSVHMGGLASSWNDIRQLYATGNRLWMLTKQQSYNSPYIFAVTKNAMNRDTILHSSGSSPVEGGNTSGADGWLTSMNTHMFLTTHYMAPAKLSQHAASLGNTPGYIFEFNMINPTAAFIDSVYSGTGFCEYNSIYLVNTSVNAASYEWKLNGAHYAWAQDTMFNSPTAGTFTFELIAYNGTQQSTFKDSVTHTITIYQNPMVTATASKDTVCQGEPDSLFVSIAGGTAPYTYSWHNAQDNIDYPGIGDTTVVQLYTVPTFSPYIYMGLSLTDAKGCHPGNSPVLYLYVHASDSLSGHILDTGATMLPVDSGRVYLFRLNPLNPQPGDTAGVFHLSANGYYYFPSLMYGSYIAKAVADTSVAAYKGSVGTYYSNKTYPFQWDSALVIQHHTCNAGNNGGNDIQILQIPATPTGPGTITGTIEYDSTYTGGHRYINGGYQPMGAPLKGVDVKLGRNPGGSPAARTTTNNQGQFTFTNVPLGNYRIYVDIPNYGMDSVRTVALTPIDTSSIGNDYYVDSTMIRVVPIVNVSASICTGDSMLLQGAYQTAAGTYKDTLNVNGHDSVIVTTLALKPLPTLTLTTSADTICVGNSGILTVAGSATSYLWSANAGSATTTTVSISPTATDTYVATGVLNGCSTTQSIIIPVKVCAGVKSMSQTGFAFYPNPATDKFYIESDKAGSIRVLNVTGQIVLEQKVQVGLNEINIGSLPAGAYEVNRISNGQVNSEKLMINK